MDILFQEENLVEVIMQTYKSKVVVAFKKVYFKEVDHEVVVTCINGGWNVRVLTEGEVNQEIRVFERIDIGKAAREMLRWEDKCGNISKLARSARERGYCK